MKLLLPLLAGMMFILISCKKSNNHPSPTPISPGLYATVNGVKKSFNTDVTVKSVDGYMGANYSLQINGATSALDTSEMTFILESLTPFTTGTYSVNAKNYVGNGPYMVYFYTISPPASTSSYFTSIAPYIATVNITSLSSTNVQGTFSGTLLAANKASVVQVVTVTDGKFNLNF